MSYYALWLDHEVAKIIEFSPQETKMSQIKNKHHVNHHGGHQDQEKAEQQKKFFKDVQNYLKAAKEIYLMGPGQAKIEFKNYLEDHHDKQLSKAIVAVETVGKATDGELQKLAKQFFHKYNLFN